MQKDAARRQGRSEFAESLRRGALIGAAALLLILPPAVHFAPQLAHRAAGAFNAAPSQRATQRRADLGTEPASDSARRIANWVAASRDNGSHSFVILDKHDAKVFLFDRDAHLQAAAPAVLGSAIGDDTYPGVADKPLSALKPEEKTTPAGRFVAEVGESSSRGEDVVWIDYDAAVSMHRIIKVPVRLNAISTPTPEDNRLSNGCVNVPDAFYERALRPAVDRDGVVFYVLPDVRTLKQTFASYYDVDAGSKLAQH